MAWHMPGTFLEGLLTPALVPNSIGVTTTLVCHIPVQSFFLYHLRCIVSVLVKCFHFLESQGICQNCWCIPQCSQNQQGEMMFNMHVNTLCESSSLVSNRIVLTLISKQTAVIAKSWEYVQKSCFVSRCSIRCSWGWSHHQACCWLNSSLVGGIA
jgi:hypothetical protein